MLNFDQALIDRLVNVARQAGDITLKYYQSDIEIQTKDNNSPVTVADQEAEECILKHLRQIDPDIPVVAEESFERGDYPNHEEITDFWLVDALDGTKSFLNHKDDYTVNIAFVKDKKPLFGLVYAPAKDEMFYGLVDQGKAFRSLGGAAFERIQVRETPKDGLTIVASRHHATPEKVQEFLGNDYVVKEVLTLGSAFKFCAVACGIADMYPRLAPTCEWDTGAGDAVLRAAGGMVATLDNKPFTYAKRKDFLNPSFIAWGKFSF